MLIVLYLSAIVIANLAVTTFGPGVSIVCAFLFIGLDLTSRDRLHEAWHGAWLWPKMLSLIAGGSLLSYLLNSNAGPIALASFAASLASGLADTLVYTLLGKRSYMVKVNGSNLVSSAVDSLIFPALAFGFPLLWPIVIGQFVAKVTGGAVWSVVLAGVKQGRTA